LAWECCGNSGCNGSPPTETFSAVARASWSPVKTAPQSSLGLTSASSSTGTSSSSSSLAPTTSTSSNNTGNNSTAHKANTDKSSGTSLSTGAQVGIGVACGLFGLAAVLALGLLLIRRHKKRRAAAEGGQGQPYLLPADAILPMANNYAPLDHPSPLQHQELVPQPKPELAADTTTARAELEGHTQMNPK
jgi:hypothetical protein